MELMTTLVPFFLAPSFFLRFIHFLSFVQRQQIASFRFADAVVVVAGFLRLASLHEMVYIVDTFNELAVAVCESLFLIHRS